MSILSFIYQQSLLPKTEAGFGAKLRAKSFRLARKLILRVGDPACQMTIWGQPMWMPFSHERPGNLSGPGHYDALVGRVASFIQARRGKLCGIDVGANIGDTIAACRTRDGDKFLAVEPNPVFFKYLKRNLEGLPNVQLVQAACADTDTNPPPGGTGVGIHRLDTIVRQFTEFEECNFLKIDTDGHDFEVLRGARELISRTLPAVLFECQVWRNPRYVEDVLETLRFFAGNGYRFALVYDNIGYLHGPADLRDTSWVAQALFYEITCGRCYYDFLLMQDAENFLQKELEFFLPLVPNAENRLAAERAVQLIAARYKPDTEPAGNRDKVEAR
jgi:FkbM family methyltransferase